MKPDHNKAAIESAANRLSMNAEDLALRLGDGAIADSVSLLRAWLRVSEQGGVGSDATRNATAKLLDKIDHRPIKQTDPVSRLIEQAKTMGKSRAVVAEFDGYTISVRRKKA